MEKFTYELRFRFFYERDLDQLMKLYRNMENYSVFDRNETMLGKSLIYILNNEKGKSEKILTSLLEKKEHINITESPEEMIMLGIIHSYLRGPVNQKTGALLRAGINKTIEEDNLENRLWRCYALYLLGDINEAGVILKGLMENSETEPKASLLAYYLLSYQKHKEFYRGLHMFFSVDNPHGIVVLAN